MIRLHWRATTRRTPEQIIADLEAQIEQVRARAAAKDAKASPEGKAFLIAVKAIDKAITVAQEQENKDMVRALEAGRAPLSEHLIEMGVRVPRSARKGRPAA